MEINWCISQHDIDRMKKLFEELDDDGEAEVHKREKTNLSENKTRVTPTAFWHKMVSARITTQNRSGPGSRVDELSNFKPFPLSLRKVRSEGKVERFIARTVQDWGIGKNKDIAKDLATNLDLLEKGEWGKALEECNRLTTLITTTEEREVVSEERRVATYIDETFRGFGRAL